MEEARHAGVPLQRLVEPGGVAGGLQHLAGDLAAALDLLPFGRSTHHRADPIGTPERHAERGPDPADSVAVPALNSPSGRHDTDIAR
ncbi:MAG: hypothetical protein IT305_20165 [Chloroflexi bacterium]|nr:hypothetical protein [Chloroflexota bacterium]